MGEFQLDQNEKLCRMLKLQNIFVEIKLIIIQLFKNTWFVVCQYDFGILVTVVKNCESSSTTLMELKMLGGRDPESDVYWQGQW
jgi:hypothetical protein